MKLNQKIILQTISNYCTRAANIIGTYCFCDILINMLQFVNNYSNT